MNIHDRQLQYLIYVYSVFTAMHVQSASIGWSSKDAESAGKPAFSGVWYFQASRGDTIPNEAQFFASDNLPSPNALKCDEPQNLSQQFMDWLRESTSDPSVLTLTMRPTTVSPMDSMMVESDKCSTSPSTDPDSSTMERALCPWEWRLNRDENREPKLISEAKCLCRRSRSQTLVAECVPIQREFPILRRVYCDENGNYQYVKTYQTITVGCHSVMPRISPAQSASWLLRPKEI